MGSNSSRSNQRELAVSDLEPVSYTHLDVYKRQLHTQLGLGPKRLKKFFDGFSDALNALVNRYEMDISDDFWLCTHKLKEIGVDVEDWYRQKE